MSAFVHDRCVYLRTGMTRHRTARSAGHEGGHIVCHYGDMTFWETRPQGGLTVAKFERQATEFAALFFRGWGADSA